VEGTIQGLSGELFDNFVLIAMLTTTGSTLVKLSVHHSGV